MKSAFDHLFETMAEMNKPLSQPLTRMTPVQFRHGCGNDDREQDFNSCEICNMVVNSDNPGKTIKEDRYGTCYVVTVCNKCFYEPEYQETLMSAEVLNITDKD